METYHKLGRIVTIFYQIIAVVAIGACNPIPSDSNGGLLRIRIGWQTAWATQGQIAQTLLHTTALAEYGLVGQLVGATYGAPLNEAALADEVDVIFTADQPAVALLARSPQWTIIGRLMVNRVGIYVPPDSPITTVADLRGKTIAVPFGAAAQRVAIRAIAEAGLDPKQDIQFVNLDITEQASIIGNGTRSNWGEIDAMAGFDPSMALFETRGVARMLHLGVVNAVIVMNQSYIDNNPGVATRFMKAMRESILYYAQHKTAANEWFRQASQLTFSDEVLDLAASVEPNLKASSIEEVAITFTPKQLIELQEAADFLTEQGLTKVAVEVVKRVNQTYAEAAESELTNKTYTAPTIHSSR